MKLKHSEIVTLMRSLMRSLEKTPASEQAGHKAIYERLSAASVETLPPGIVEKLGTALDHAIGR